MKLTKDNSVKFVDDNHPDLKKLMDDGWESDSPKNKAREELELEANRLGIKFHPNISDVKLKERIENGNCS